MHPRMIQVFRDFLIEQVDYDKDKSSQLVLLEDVLLEDIVVTGGENAPKVKKMENGKFAITAKTSGMMAYSTGEGGGVHRSKIGSAKMELESKFVRAYYVLSHEQLVAVSGGASAMIDAADEYREEVQRAMLRAKSRYLRSDGTGISGVLPEGIVDTDTVIISDREPGTIESHNFYGLGTDEFMEGEPLLFGTKAMFTGGTAVEATIEYTVDSNKLKLVSSVIVGAATGANNRGGTNVDTWYIVRGTREYNEYDKVPMGYFGLIDDGKFVPTCQTKDRATTPWMKSICFDKADTATILKDFRDLYNQLKKYGRPKFFKVSTDIYDAYYNALPIALQGKENSYESKQGIGHAGLVFQYGNSGALPILNDNFFPAGQVLLLDPEMFIEATLYEENFLPDYVLKAINASTEIGYETIRAAYGNFGTWGSRKGGAKINYQSI